MVVKQPKFTRVEEPTLLCNQVKWPEVPYSEFGGSNLFSGLGSFSDLENSAKLAGDLKIQRSRYVPVRRNLTVFCVFGVSKNQ